MSTTTRGLHRREQGHVSMRLIVAVSVATILTVCSLVLFLRCCTLNETSGGMTRALAEAASKLDEIRCADFDAIIETYREAGARGTPFQPLTPDAEGLGIVYVRSAQDDLLHVEVVVSWREGARGIIGEDANLNGVLDPGEDRNSNGRIDSPASLATLIARK